jgi:urease accessory protein
MRAGKSAPPRPALQPLLSGIVTAVARWRFLQIADSSFPVGGFAHSAGLEAMVHRGQPRTFGELDAYVGVHVWNVGHSALPFVSASFDAPHEIRTLDARLDAFLTNQVANRASRTQGRAFVGTCARVFDAPPLAALVRDARDRNVPAHLGPLFGATLAALGLERSETLILYLHGALRGVVSAAVRLGVVGPHEAQRIQDGHGATLDAVLAQCADLRPSEAANVAPAVDVVAATHDRLYARLFQS